MTKLPLIDLIIRQPGKFIRARGFVMAFPTAQVSAPGLTQGQLQDEQTWIKNFMQNGDSLDWSKWEKWWATDAFLQFGNTPRIQGREAISHYLKPQLEVLEFMHHEIIRLSFDLALGLIYSTTDITYKVKANRRESSKGVRGIR
ncbi:hypothetical protein OPQ81_002365 [Rhizoctonia solani]|nr:hypothetical protein OPQ81_002365 [Rhizoctonia solani]